MCISYYTIQQDQHHRQAIIHQPQQSWKQKIWILAIRANDLISPDQSLQDLQNTQFENKAFEIEIILSKRDTHDHIRTSIGERWTSFVQTRMINMKVVDSDSNNMIAAKANNSA